jgi:hypothetical protein
MDARPDCQPNGRMIFSFYALSGVHVGPDPSEILTGRRTGRTINKSVQELAAVRQQFPTQNGAELAAVSQKFGGHRRQIGCQPVLPLPRLRYLLPHLISLDS